MALSISYNESSEGYELIGGMMFSGSKFYYDGWVPIFELSTDDCLWIINWCWKIKKKI